MSYALLLAAVIASTCALHFDEDVLERGTAAEERLRRQTDQSLPINAICVNFDPAVNAGITLQGTGNGVVTGPVRSG